MFGIKCRYCGNKNLQELQVSLFVAQASIVECQGHCFMTSMLAEQRKAESSAE